MPAARAEQRDYHHGDLRRVVLIEAASMIDDSGPAALNLRELARRAGVAHTSITHHFGDKTGLYTALATEGFALLRDELERTLDEGGTFLDLGVAYARFATRHTSHFQVMFRPEFYDPEDASLTAAKEATLGILYGHADELVSDPDESMTMGIAGWALVHGLTELFQSGALPGFLGTDLEEITREVAVRLGGPQG